MSWTSTISIPTGKHSALIDITAKVSEAITQSGVHDGLCCVYIPHTTCGITINENADPSVKQDLLMEIAKIVPWEDGYRHSEGNSAAHLKASLMGFSLTIPVSGGRLSLGTWQGILFCEFDGPRTRSAVITMLSG